MALSAWTTNRLYNWKFDQALTAVAKQTNPNGPGPRPTDHELHGIQGLAEAFGNVGWFEGALARVVELAVHDLIGDTE